MTSIIELTTHRLRLRQWQPSDFELFAALNADSTVMEYFPAPLSRPDSDAMALRCQALIAERGWGLWAVETLASQQFIGYVGLHIPSADLPCSPCVEIGWRLARIHWGQGYATEAAKASLKVGFEQLELPEIVSFTSLHNRRSQAVMERIGMVRTADTFEHPKLPPGHWLREHCLYRMTHDQYQGTKTD